MLFNPGLTTGPRGLLLKKTNKGDFQNLSFNGSNVEAWSNVEACSSQKYLWLTIDDKPNFDAHVQIKISKCNKTNGIVKWLSIILP